MPDAADIPYEFDPNKSDRNLADRGFSFKRARGFEWATAMEYIDNRFNYPEIRCVAYGVINNRIYAMAFTRLGSKIRIISLRKANRKEARTYVDFKA